MATPHASAVAERRLKGSQARSEASSRPPSQLWSPDTQVQEDELAKIEYERERPTTLADRWGSLMGRLAGDGAGPARQFLANMGSAFGKPLIGVPEGAVRGLLDVGKMGMDLATSPIASDEWELLGETMTGSAKGAFQQHGGNALMNLIGPDDGLGVLIEELPDPVRDVGGTMLEEFAQWMDRGFTASFGDAVSGNMIALNAVERFLRGEFDSMDEAREYLLDVHSERFGHEVGAGEALARMLPFGTALRTVALEDEGVEDLDSGMFDEDDRTRKEGMSPGQLATFSTFNLGGVDLTDDVAVQQYMSTDFFKVASGLSDAAMRLFLDPDIMAGKALKARYASTIARRIDTTQLDELVESPKVQQFLDDVDELPLDQLVDKSNLKGHTHGFEIGHLLKQAEDKPTRAMLLRHMLGDAQAADDLAQFRGDLLAKVERQTNAHKGPISPVDEVRAASGGAVDVEAARTARLNDWENFQWIRQEGDELPEVIGRVDRLQELSQVFTHENQLLSRGALSMLPGGSKLDESVNLSARQLGYHVQHSPIFQKGPLSYPVQVAGNLLNKQPHRFLRLAHSDSAEQVRRQLKKSKLDRDAQEALVRQYVEAGTPTERLNIYNRIEDAAVVSILEAKGASRESVEAVLERASELRNQSTDLLRDTNHHRVHRYDGQSRDVLEVTGEGGELIVQPMPMFVNQTADIAPMVDLDFIHKATSKVGKRALQSKAWYTTNEGLDFFTRAWKTGMLFRPAWMGRVLLLDESLRVLAKMGTFTNKFSRKERWGDWGDGFRDYMNDVTNVGALGRWSERFGELPIGRATGQMTERAPKDLDALGKHAERLRDPATGEIKYDWLRAKDLRIPGIGRHAETQMAPFRVPGTDVTVDPVWTKGDKSEVYQRMLSSKASFDKLLGREEQTLLQGLRGSGKFKSLESTDVGYYGEWANRLNLQIGQDELTSRILREHLDGSGDMSKVRSWLADTEEGAVYRSRIPWRRDLDEWVDMVEDQVLDYTRGEEGLMRGALGGSLTPEELQKLQGELPVIHGEALDQVLGQGPVTGAIKDFIDVNMERLGTFSSDRLMRQTFARRLYREDMYNRVHGMLASKKKRGLAEELSRKELERMQELSRQHVVKETQNLLYNFADTNRLTEMLRHVVPFYGAWQEAMVAWLQLGVERPDFLARAHKVWRSPERVADMETVDQDGNTYVTVPMPESARNIPFFGEFFEEQDNLRIQKQHLNLIFEGPGFGAFVNIPTSKLVEGRPELEDAVEFILPYGPRPAVDELLPGMARRGVSVARKEDDRAYRNAMMRFWQIEAIKYEQGDRFDQPTHAEVKKKADRYFMLRTIAGSTLPATPQWPSPYEPHINALQQLRDEDPLTADERFLEMFGDDFFALTESVTKTVNGMPPSVEAWKRYQDDPRIQELVDEFPELGNLIIGAEGGEFSRSVYNAQLATSVREGSGEAMREPKSMEEWQEGYQRRLGWIRYQQAMQEIDMLQSELGLPNLQVKDAELLAAYKRQKVAAVAAEFPEWERDYMERDFGRSDRRMYVFRELASDPQFLQRPEIQGLDVYLTSRDMVAELLRQRREAGGAGTLDAAANQDVAETWQMITSLIRERNPAFGDLYFRYLDRDVLSANDVEAAA